MTSPASSILRCDDGTELPFEWVYPDAEQSEWIRDRSHWPQPLTPMEVWLRQTGWPPARTARGRKSRWSRRQCFTGSNLPDRSSTPG